MKRGFTLIELLIVIAIIGILASLVLVSLNAARNKGTNVRTQAEIAQIRTSLEQGFANSAYIDLQGAASHVAVISATSTNPDLPTLFCGIGKQSGYPTNVTGDIVLACDGIPSLHSGVVIYSNDTGDIVHDYGIYASTTPGGYVCTDSFGNSQATTSKGIPTYAGLTSPTSALCQ